MAVSQQLYGPNPLMHLPSYHLLLLTYKLMCYKRSKETRFQPYMDSLPVNDLSMLPSWQGRVVGELNSQYLIQYIKICYQIDHVLYSGLFSPQKNVVSKGLALEDEFVWALRTATSRHMIYDNRSAAVVNAPSFGVHVCPVVDYLNHSFEPNCVAARDKDLGVTVQSLRRIEAGEQLLINYGNMPNYALAHKYGFAVENSPFSSLHLAFNCSSYSAIINDGAETKTRLIQKHLGVADPTNCCSTLLYRDHLDPTLLPKLRVWMMTPEEAIGQYKTKHTDFMKPLGRMNEARARDCLSCMLSEHLTRLTRVDYGKLKQSLRRFRTVDEYNRYTAAILEEEELAILRGNLALLAKLP